MNVSAGKLWGLRRLADDQGIFKMVAVDQRPPIKDLVKAARGSDEAAYDDVALVKRLLVEELADGASAMLLDPHFAYPKAIDVVSPRQGLLLTLEDSVFVETERGRLSSSIDDWSVEKIRRVGGDAVKLLAWYRPDADKAVREHQTGFVARIGDECRRYDIPFLFELLVYSFPGDASTPPATSSNPRSDPITCSRASPRSPHRSTASTCSSSRAPCRPPTSPTRQTMTPARQRRSHCSTRSTGCRPCRG